MTIAAAALLGSLAAMLGLLVFPPRRDLTVRKEALLRSAVADALAI